MAPMDHLFDDHHLCDASWCHTKNLPIMILPHPYLWSKKRKRGKKTYYRSMVDDAELYEAMVKKYGKYISKKYLLQCQHSFDNQINEEMNNSIAAYTGKDKHYAGTSSLITRVLIADGVHLVGCHHFWISCFKLLEVTIMYQLHSHLLSLDKEEVIRYH